MHSWWNFVIFATSGTRRKRYNSATNLKPSLERGFLLIKTEIKVLTAHNKHVITSMIAAGCGCEYDHKYRITMDTPMV